MRSIFTISLLFIFSSLLAQEENPEAPVTQGSSVTVSSFTAQVLVSSNLEAMFLNVVGAGIRYSHRHTSVSLTIFPSLSFKEDRRDVLPENKKPFVRPGFAIGPLFQYKRIMMGLPTFYQDDEWHFTVGVGVKFGK